MTIIEELEVELRPLIVHDTGTVYAKTELLERVVKVLRQCEFLVQYSDTALTYDFLRWAGWDIEDAKKGTGYAPGIAGKVRTCVDLPDPIYKSEDLKHILDGIYLLGTSGMISEYMRFYTNLVNLCGTHSLAEKASPRQLMLAVLKTVQPDKFHTTA